MLSILLAEHLSKSGSCLIVNMNTIVPALPLLLPFKAIDKEKSLGMALGAINNIPESEQSFSDIARYLNLHPKNDNIAIMAMASGDTPMMYPPPSKSTIQGLMRILSNSPFDYIIYDGSSSVYTDQGTFWALKLAEYRLCALTPDISGLEWYRSQALWRKNTEENERSVMDAKIINLSEDIRASEVVANEVGGVEYFLPYSTDLRNLFRGGKLPSGLLDRQAKEYLSVIKNLANKIKEE